MHVQIVMIQRINRGIRSIRRTFGSSRTLFSSMLLLVWAGQGPAGAQEITQTRSAANRQGESESIIELTLERMVDLALSNSYQVKQLNLGIERTQLRLKAERARLRSSLDLELSAPQFRSISETRWNSTIQRNEIIHENSRRMEAELSIRQPVVVFGFPTNGYLSLNNRMYRYSQLEQDGDRDIRYYNRYFVRYTQPLFQPNGLKNDLEEAELNLEGAELNFYDDVVEIVDDTSDDYFQLFEDAYNRRVNERYVANLEAAMELAQAAATADSNRTIDADQVRVEQANAREQLQEAESQFRLQAARLRTDFNLPQDAAITLEPTVDLQPVLINVEEATRYALELTPRLRQLDIAFRENEINLENTKGRNSFRLDLAFSYGREMQDEIFADIWGSPTNTYTIDVNAFVPIWDWGERDARIEASQIGLEQTRLRIEQATVDIRSNVENEVRNVEEFQTRALAMEENLTLAREVSETSLERYGDGTISALDLLQSLRREVDTADNFLDAYLGWRKALLRLQEMTYYDFERNAPVLERFGVSLFDASGTQ